MDFSVPAGTTNTLLRVAADGNGAYEEKDLFDL
jgi:hypothetical protein